MRKIIIISLILTFLSCVERINLIKETTLNSFLVVEATITDKIDFQEVHLRRSSPLDSIQSNLENNATIRVIGDEGSVYSFQQNANGVYTSQNKFSASFGVNYSLEITTQDGNQYKSENSSLTSKSKIKKLYLKRDFNEKKEEGISIYVDTENPENLNQLLRFDYQETYKIIAPTYHPYELIIQNDDLPYSPEVLAGLTPKEVVAFFVTLEQKEKQERICYNTVRSKKIQLENSKSFEQNVLEKYRIRFIDRFNYIMSHRYSILVKQYTQSSQAHEYYKTLRQFSEGSGNVLSQVQPGFIEGNIKAVNNPDENIIGYFEVTSLDEKRIYFNYKDLFPGEDLPPYYKPCHGTHIPELYTRDQLTGIIDSSPIQEYIVWTENKYIRDNPEDNNLNFPYVMTTIPACGDCTVLGKNSVPDFWQD
ncbi:uncharacterized protein DUF4249 [Lutibacter sp. Hel_I_33_5]|nr:uncharacterized protein DUF4249 [Lutibacter sp. Hel_I_33_5]